MLFNDWHLGLWIFPMYSGGPAMTVVLPIAAVDRSPDSPLWKKWWQNIIAAKNAITVLLLQQHSNGTEIIYHIINTTIWRLLGWCRPIVGAAPVKCPVVRNLGPPTVGHMHIKPDKYYYVYLELKWSASILPFLYPFQNVLLLLKPQLSDFSTSALFKKLHFLY